MTKLSIFSRLAAHPPCVSYEKRFRCITSTDGRRHKLSSLYARRCSWREGEEEDSIVNGIAETKARDFSHWQLHPPQSKSATRTRLRVAPISHGCTLACASSCHANAKNRHMWQGDMWAAATCLVFAHASQWVAFTSYGEVRHQSHFPYTTPVSHSLISGVRHRPTFAAKISDIKRVTRGGMLASSRNVMQATVKLKRASTPGGPALIVRFVSTVGYRENHCSQ